MTRRSRRTDLQPQYAAESVEVDEEAEVTRCVCGREELDADASDPGFFIQCEMCSVWQHGNCVGIAEETDAPDIYWCELCRPELHNIFTDSHGITKSKYDPLGGSNSGNSSSTGSGRGKHRADPRDQLYENQLKQALEESKRLVGDSEVKQESEQSHPAKDNANEVKDTSDPAQEMDETANEESQLEIKNEEEKFKEPVAKVTKPKTSRKSKKSAASSSSKNNNASLTSSSSSSSGSGFKANIPSAKISHVDMTRRVFAIMEFLANIQTNLSGEDKFRNMLKELGEKNLDRSLSGAREDLIKMYNESVEGVDELMSCVNEWVQTFDE